MIVIESILICPGEASDTAGSSPLSETCPVNQLSVFQELLPNDCIRSLSDLHELVYQEDGDLVLYANGIRRWASNTAGLAPGSVFVSEDGNLIMHDSTEQVVWSTGTKAEAGSNAHILLQEDGNVVLCAHDGTNLWSTGTVCDLSGKHSFESRMMKKCWLSVIFKQADQIV